MADDDHAALTAETPFKSAMRSLIAPRFHAVWKAIPEAIDDSNPEGVHDVRVASRRLRAAMDVGADCFPKSWFKPLHKTAKEITSALGAVRDRDVLLEFLIEERRSAPASDAPGLDRLIARVERERGEAREEMMRFLRSVEKRKIEESGVEAIRRWREGRGFGGSGRVSRAWKVKGIDPRGTLGDNARRILAVRVAEFYSWEPAIDDDAQVKELHQLRISAKRLRYSLELFREVFDETGERTIERVRQVQEQLGVLHDIEVRIDLIEQELRRLAVERTEALCRELAAAAPSELPAIASSAMRPPPDDPRRGLINLLIRQHAARTLAVSRFREQWRALDAGGLRQDLASLSQKSPEPGQTA